MQKRKILAVDVDLTVVDAVTKWKSWYINLTGHDIGEVTSENNNLETLMHKHDDPLVFWKKPDLYDDLSVYPEALSALTKLSEYVDIIFVSACFPEHETSKKYLLERSFPFMKGFISTTAKQFTKCDFFVDDYKKYCRLVQEAGCPNVYQIKTNINSSSNGEFPYMDWEEITEDILGKI